MTRPLYPINLVLDGRPVLLVGGGVVGGGVVSPDPVP